jgi:hypothetical protein
VAAAHAAASSVVNNDDSSSFSATRASAFAALTLSVADARTTVLHATAASDAVTVAIATA